ncbi:hypothetical protein [Pseudomonas sp. CMR5c]|uniref:hypothetical protein n=1 Tax=Pseudomonas sp. CMR5c TaxID=658630 RepID=UPI000AD6ED41|nr:hypothetical protein [Pseudomonas sp. CMR5c]AZC20107.1 hypothetical protein C4K40_4740 [Pseudomonas sp. CMR5c]
MSNLFDRDIGVDDLDKPIYRIFPQWALAEAIRLKRLTLVPPHFWDDPFEVVERSVGINFRSKDGPFRQEILGQNLSPIYAQSWSATAESDTLLRAYSRVVKDPRHDRNLCPGDEGVQVRTTARKLLSALESGLDNKPVRPFIGDVHYADTEAIVQSLANQVSLARSAIFEDEDNRIKLLMMKRLGFAHENEVRIGALSRDGFKNPDPVLHFDVDIHSLIDEITFDPRLAMFEERERQRVFEGFGYKGPFGSLKLYEKKLFLVELHE